MGGQYSRANWIIDVALRRAGPRWLPCASPPTVSGDAYGEQSIGNLRSYASAGAPAPDQVSLSTKLVEREHDRIPRNSQI